jgi:hypothetical protein
MFIDNKKTTIGVKLKKRILILVLIIAVIIFFSFNFFRESFLGITGIGYTIILSGLIIIYHAWCIVRDYHYFYFSEQGAKLVFRFYSLSSLFKRPNSIEIKKNEFHKFQIENKLLGFRQYLLLYQQMPGGIAKYPPISISLLRKSEKKDLFNTLSTKYS